MVDPRREPVYMMRFTPVDIDTVRQKRGWFVAMGLASIVLGVLAIVLPYAATILTTVVVGWLIVLAGVTEGYHALENRGWAGAGWELVSAAVQMIAGFLLVFFPLVGKLALIVVVAAYFFAQGVLKLIRASQHRWVKGMGWLVFDGFLSMVLGIIMIAGGLGTAIRLLGLLVGFHLLAGGLSMVIIGNGAGLTRRV
jgi:uncharacterized membrane protein HdeD (DUF308 family)